MNASPFVLDGVWPPQDLENAPRCEVCGSTARVLWLDGLTDRIHRCAPGRWTLWRCASCDAAQLDPRPTPASIARAYGAYHTHQAPERHFLVPGDRPDLWLRRALHAGFYARRFGHRLTPAWPVGWWAIEASARRRVRAGQSIRHLPAATSGAALLDVGCGDGGFLRVARALGFEARGIEFDLQAAQQVRALGFDVQSVTIDAASVPEASLDHITLSHVIEHLHHPLAALQRMRGWLRPGGRIWLQTPNGRGAGAERYAAHWRGLEPPRHLVLFGPRSLRQALERAGYVDVELLPPQLDGEFFIGQSEAIRDGRDPYRLDKAASRAARRAGRAWDREALARPEQADSLTMVAHRPR